MTSSSKLPASAHGVPPPSLPTSSVMEMPGGEISVDTNDELNKFEVSPNMDASVDCVPYSSWEGPLKEIFGLRYKDGKIVSSLIGRVGHSFILKTLGATECGVFRCPLCRSLATNFVINLSIQEFDSVLESMGGVGL
ncbi:hypothetical protein LWI29_010093 [Acer saccharum]|uniref:Uncharacterized protein n=1 Tax=Acer saccharum TaxID=4024 RepID=A0AA39RVN3_ACESA|nr:hypothetical protein LWI29_010093 [Acer saccharum]